MAKQMQCPKYKGRDVTFLRKGMVETSGAKLKAGVLTMGASLLFAGTKTSNKKNLEFLCNNCGYRWLSK